MKFPNNIVVLLLFLSITINISAQQEDWWNIPYPKSFDKTKLESEQSFISVDGNKFVDENGDQVIFKGLNISDPDKLQKNGKWSKKHFEIIKEWGANLVRVPIHPIAWKMRGEEEYFKLLDQAVIWASELNLHLIFEWHSIGNLKNELYQHQMHITTQSETYQFWRTISFRYKEVSTVAFYEIFNEPTVAGGQLGKITWQEWKKINEEIISIIFTNDKKVIPLVAGFNWAYELTGVKNDPIKFDGIGYVSHPYPQKTSEPLEENWENRWGYVADKYPLICTELGFMAEEDPGSHIPCIGDVLYGKRITEYLATKGASWTVWCFDPDWPPQMIKDWNYTPTVQGEFFRKIIQK